MEMTRFDVEITKHGAVHDPAQVDALAAGVADVTDVFVLAHGWNNDVAEARALYDELLGNTQRLLDIRDTPGAPASITALEGRTFAACQLFWPSKRFADADLIPGGGAASATAQEADAVSHVLDALADDPDRLGESTTDPARQAIVEQAKQLLPRLELDPDARAQYLSILRSLLDPAESHEEDGSTAFFEDSAETLFDSLEDEVVAPAPRGVGGATAVGSAGGAAGLGDLFRGAKAAARRLANFATYYRMKARAGDVGAGGAAAVLHRCRQQNAALRLHLVGHSFGGRVVTAAANALEPDTPAVTITLLQAAYSHNGLSGDYDDRGSPGFFRRVVSEKRVSGPIVITHTKNDTAVGIAYPLASRIARQKAAALGDENDPYGGLGRNGAQRTVEAEGRGTSLGEVGTIYRFTQGAIYNLRADSFISGHGDVRGLQVAYAILSAAGAV